METVDVAIVGGGVVGLSIAYELSRTTNLTIALYDKSGPGSGTSGRSAGVICRHDHAPIYQRLSLIGHARMRSFEAEFGLGFNAWGVLDIVRAPRPFPPEDRAAAELGNSPSGMYANELLDRDALLARFPWVAPEDILGGVFEPRNGFINPFELIDLYRSLLLQTDRVALDYGNPVLALNREGGRVTSVATRRGTVRAGVVVNASGAWANKVAALAGAELRITPQRMNVVVASPTGGGFPDLPLHGAPGMEWDGDGVWCRGETGGTALFGQHRDKTDPARPAADPDFFDARADNGFDARVQATLERYYRLPAHVVLNGWTCVYDTSDDGFPILGYDPQVANLIHAVGMNGHGMTIHAGVARCVGALVRTGSRMVDISDVMPWPETLDFSPLRPERFAEGEPLALFADRTARGME
jgi:sarcosine oxidase subunit beta